MPITFTPEREGRVYVWTFGEVFNAQDMTNMIDVFQQTVLNAATKKVYIIADFTSVRRLPPNIMSAALKMMKKSHPMRGPIIEATPNGLIYALAGAFVKLTPSNTVIVCRTLTEAFAEADRLLVLESEESIQENP